MIQGFDHGVDHACQNRNMLLAITLALAVHSAPGLFVGYTGIGGTCPLWRAHSNTLRATMALVRDGQGVNTRITTRDLTRVG